MWKNGIKLQFLDFSFLKNVIFSLPAKRKENPIEDEKTILRKMRRMTDYYEIHKEIGR